MPAATSATVTGRRCSPMKSSTPSALSAVALTLVSSSLMLSKADSFNIRIAHVNMLPTSSNIVDAFLFLNYACFNNGARHGCASTGGTFMDMLIDGGWTGASDGSVDPVLNPATNDQIATVPRATVADVERAVAAAQRGKARDGGDAGVAALRNP